MDDSHIGISFFSPLIGIEATRVINSDPPKNRECGQSECSYPPVQRSSLVWFINMFDALMA